MWWRTGLSVALMIVGVSGVYQLMVSDAHFLLLALFGAVCGAAIGLAFRGPRGLALGTTLGFVLPLAYLPVWLAFDLPPHLGIDL